MLSVCVWWYSRKGAPGPCRLRQQQWGGEEEREEGGRGEEEAQRWSQGHCRHAMVAMRPVCNTVNVIYTRKQRILSYCQGLFNLVMPFWRIRKRVTSGSFFKRSHTHTHTHTHTHAQDMLQSTDALTFQAGDLEALNLLLNHSLARLADAEVAGEGGRGRDGGDDGVAGGGGSTSSAGGQDQCWKAKRVQQDVCRRHSVADKILRIMSEQHEAQLDSRVAACRHEQRVADPRSLPRQLSRGLADTCVASGLGFL